MYTIVAMVTYLGVAFTVLMCGKKLFQLSVHNSAKSESKRTYCLLS